MEEERDRGAFGVSLNYVKNYFKWLIHSKYCVCVCGVGMLCSSTRCCKVYFCDTILTYFPPSGIFSAMMVFHFKNHASESNDWTFKHLNILTFRHFIWLLLLFSFRLRFSILCVCHRRNIYIFSMRSKWLIQFDLS